MRASWARELIEQATYLDVHGGTPFPLALGLPLSYLRAYFDSTIHQQHTKSLEAKGKIDSAVVGRLDVLISAFGSLARALSRRR